MITKHKIIEIDENDIFKNDRLNRKEIIEDLSTLLKTTTDSLVLSLNAKWGAGKTTFVKMWKAYLKKEKNINSIYFSAWEDDFSKEPLISIIGEIEKYINDNFRLDYKIQKSLDNVIELSGKVLKRGLPSLLKGIIAKYIDLNVLNEDFKEAIGAIVEATSKELINNYSKDKGIVEKFKKSIQDLLSHIDKGKPFVIFIDELDRCRPLYAIELLERIKHIFGIDGLIFVLSIDKQQLAESIKSQYGNIDTDNYLRRFIDMEYNLQNSNVDDFCKYLYYDVFKLTEVLNSKKIKCDDDEVDMIKYLSKSTDMSLRQIEQVFIQIYVIAKTIQPQLSHIYLEIIMLFVVLKMEYPKEYELLKKQELEENKLFDLLISKEEKSKGDRKNLIKAIILATSKTEMQLNKIIKEQNDILENIQSEMEILKQNNSSYNFSNLQKKYSSQKHLIGLLDNGVGGFIRLNKAIETVIKKVEFSDKFNFNHGN